MLKKIYDKIEKYINDNIKELIFLLGFYVFMTYPLPYFVLVSGGTIDVSDRVEIADEYDQKGSFNLAYVNELRGTFPTVMLSYIIPSWTLYEESDYTADETESIEDISMRDHLSLKESQQNSVKIAYEAAQKEFTIQTENYYIYYVVDFAKEYSNLRVGDKLLSYDGIKIKDIDEYRDYIDKKAVGEEIKIEYERNGKKYDTILKIYEEENIKYTGIMVYTLYDYITNPKIEFSFSSNESGSSGGLTLSLAIYNKLTKEDITKGLKIVGTGTIESDGSVGEIGGVEYKLKGAVKAKADIFLVPSGNNYKDAIKAKEKHNYDIDIIEVSTFEDALKKLKDYNK